MNHQMTHEMSYPMFYMWWAILVVFGLVFGGIYFFSRNVRNDSFLVADLAKKSSSALQALSQEHDDPEQELSSAHDTIFILPDISHYTRFMTGNQFAFAHAQYIVFSLINAMIRSATKTVELSKLEGDAALFFVDAVQHSPAVVGDTVLEIFQAFFSEQKHLMDTNICRCKACQSIGELDLKIFVHRGNAARFEFRGSIDHFGTDVIILHRMMKNEVNDHRYVMVTEAASDSIALHGVSGETTISENLEHVGKVKASVFPISDELKRKLVAEPKSVQKGAFSETLTKLKMNAKTLLNVFR